MIDKIKLTIYSQWDSDQGFLIWGKNADGSLCNLEELKLNLFTWHERSFYGTFLPVVLNNGILVIKLSPLEALEFFTQPPDFEFLSIQWPQEIIGLQKIAPIIQKLLADGSWMPDYNKWQLGERGWKLRYPLDTESKEGITYLDEWVNAIINELVVNIPGISQTWQSIQEKYPLVSITPSEAMQIIDEDDWLTAIGWKEDKTPFRTCLQLCEPDDILTWSLKVLLVDKENNQVIWELNEESEDFEGYPNHWQPFLDRPKKDILKWVNYLPWLKDQDEIYGLKSVLTEEEAWEFLNSTSLMLVELGYTVFLPVWWDDLRKQKARLRAKTKSSVGASQNSRLGLQQIIQFDWQLAIGDMEMSVEEFRQIAKEKRRLLKIHGQWVQVDPLYLKQLQKIINEKGNSMSLGEVMHMHLSPKATALTVYDELEQVEGNSIAVEIELNSYLAGMMKQLTELTAIPIEEPPQTFNGVLRNYQRTGYSWLMFLRKFGLGGCLADDMGLGKTVQLINYLLAIKEREVTNSPSLLICPTSVIGNWQMELKRFAPTLEVYLHYGPSRSKEEEFPVSCQNKDLVITSYNLAQIDEDELKSIDWNSICLDEAQFIKNTYTKQAAAIRKLTGGHRVALTGTPMENRLTELWSIMDFLNPGYLGTLSAFNKQFVNVIERSRDLDVVDKVQRLVRPFLLRRTKNDSSIELDLPEKQEFKEYITLTIEQASLYENILEDMFDRLDKVTAMERRGIILATLTKLKQVCNHPALFLKEGKGSSLRSRSNKLERLLGMVQELRSEGDSCLIFTQYVEMGHFLRELLQNELEEHVQFLHGGSTKIQRDNMIARFQDQSLSAEEGCGIFILSLKAGGTGLNLTAANHVFHFDRWWNPAVENQATDRAHRIGQNRNVQVHKFICLGTIEERIDNMIEEKQSLNELVVGSGESWITELSTKDLREIFALRKEWVSAD